MTAIRTMKANGWGLVLKDFTKDGRHGIDLVFRRRIGNAVEHATVEAKGFSQHSPFFKPSPKYGDLPGSATYTERVARQAAAAGNRDAAYLLKRLLQGKVRYFTSFIDGLRQFP